MCMFRGSFSSQNENRASGEIYVFFWFKDHMFYVLYRFVTYLLNLPRSPYGNSRALSIHNCVKIFWYKCCIEIAGHVCVQQCANSSTAYLRILFDSKIHIWENSTTITPWHSKDLICGNTSSCLSLNTEPTVHHIFVLALMSKLSGVKFDFKIICWGKDTLAHSFRLPPLKMIQPEQKCNIFIKALPPFL
jgi:hypothetical protein